MAGALVIFANLSPAVAAPPRTGAPVFVCLPSCVCVSYLSAMETTKTPDDGTVGSRVPHVAPDGEEQAGAAPLHLLLPAAAAGLDGGYVHRYGVDDGSAGGATASNQRSGTQSAGPPLRPVRGGAMCLSESPQAAASFSHVPGSQGATNDAGVTRRRRTRSYEVGTTVAVPGGEPQPPAKRRRRHGAVAATAPEPYPEVRHASTGTYDARVAFDGNGGDLRSESGTASDSRNHRDDEDDAVVEAGTQALEAQARCLRHSNAELRALVCASRAKLELLEALFFCK